MKRASVLIPAATCGFQLGGGFGLESVTEKISHADYQHAVFLAASGIALGRDETLDFREKRAKSVTTGTCKPVEGEKVPQCVAGYAAIDCAAIVIALKRKAGRPGPETFCDHPERQCKLLTPQGAAAKNAVGGGARRRRVTYESAGLAGAAAGAVSATTSHRRKRQTILSVFAS